MSAGAETRPRLRLGVLVPLRDPGLALLWGGLATSSIGDQLFIVVLTWVSVSLLGSAAGYVSALQGAVGLLASLLAGHWADRMEQRRLMIVADLARAAILIGLMALWLTLGSPPVWSLFVCVAVLAIGQSVFRPAMQTVLPALAGDVSHLPAANALLDTTERIARLLGPGLVGVASTVLPLVQFVTIDAASFVVSAAAVLAITRIRPAAPAPQTSRGPILANVLRGFRAIRRNGLLQFSLLTTPVTNGAWYASVFLGVPLLVQRYGAGGLAAYGAVISSYGLTNLASTLVVGSLGVARHPARWIYGGNLVLGCGIAGFGVSGLLAPPDWLFACLLASSGLAAIGGPMQDITMATLRQTALPGPDLPAGVRAFMVLNALGTLVALAASPRLFDGIGVPWAILLCAAAILAVGVTGLLRHGGDLMPVSPGPRTE